MTLLVEGVGLGHELRALRERGGGEERCEPARSATLARPGLRADQRVDPAKRASARAHYLEGVGLRATERLVGVSHKAVGLLR